MTVYYGILAPSISPQVWFTEVIDIRLNGGTTLMLAKGLFSAVVMNDAYALMLWNAAQGHLEILVGGAWQDFAVTDTAPIFGSFFYSNGDNLRFANGAGGGIWYRLVGLRAY